jgi:uncharacterized integral membrane protein
MRFLSYTVFFVLTFVIIMLAVANRQLVRVNLIPDFTAYGVPASPDHEVPLFSVALICGTLGFILGAAREYLRESRLRRESRKRGKELGALKREVDALKGAQKQPEDDDDDLLLLTSR